MVLYRPVMGWHGNNPPHPYDNDMIESTPVSNSFMTKTSPLKTHLSVIC